MICSVVFTRQITEGGFIYKKLELPFQPADDMIFIDGTSDELEISNPKYYVKSDNIVLDGAFVIEQAEIAEVDIPDYTSIGWVEYEEEEE
jgi:hypothetical protein